MKRIYIFLSLLLLSLPVLADEIKKDTDFFTNFTFPSVGVIVNRFDGVNEILDTNTGLLYEINYDNYTQIVNPFSILITGYTSSNYNRDDSLKMSRDINNDIYLAGNTGVGCDVIKKYTNNVEQWSITPKTDSNSFVIGNGLILSKNNNFLYAIYNNNGSYGFVGRREIYKINKQTGEYSVIYSTPMPTSGPAAGGIRCVVDDQDNIYLLSATDSKKLVLQKINSSGSQIFFKEFTGTGDYIKAQKIMFLDNGLIFIKGNDGWTASSQLSAAGVLNDIIATLDAQGNIVSNFIKINTMTDTGSLSIDYAFTDADTNSIYYLYWKTYFPSTNPSNKIDGGISEVLIYNYQNQLVNTLYLPYRTSNANASTAYGTYSYDTAHLNPFVKNKRLYVPQVVNYELNTSPTVYIYNASYSIDLNNPLISLKYSEDQNFIDKTSNPTYISQKSQNITFRVKYKNFRAKAPALLRVHVYADGVSVTSSPFSMVAVNPDDIDYAKGVDYLVSVPMTCTATTVYSYQFELTDGVSLFNSDTYVLPNYLPAKPVAISHNANGEKVSAANVLLEWSCGTSSVTYVLQMDGPYDNPTNTYSWATKYSGSSTTYSLANLEVGKYYYWKVSAANFSGVTEESDVFFFRAFDMPVTPVRVSPKDKVEISGDPNIRIEWSCPTPNVTYSLKIAGPYDSPVSTYAWAETYNGARNYYVAPFFETGKYYYWKVSAANSEGDIAESEIFNFNITKLGGKKAFNAPNPFNPAKGQQTTFVFDMPESGTAKIEIYSEYGDKVWESETFSEPSGQGAVQVTYNGKDNSGKMLYNGTYLAVITKKYSGKTSVEKCRILVVK